MADNLPRDRQSQGASRSLVPSNGYGFAYQQQPGSSWFGPLAPLPPVAPPSVKGRILDYPSGYNLTSRPRPYEPISFEQLRAFADSFDLVRVVIETRKDQLARMNWIVKVREQFKDKAEDPALMTKIEVIKEFFLRPNKEDFWPEWLRMVLEDLFVIDAPSIHRRLTVGGELYALDPLDGATIKRVIDDAGRTPAPPDPAYQQVLKGLPAVNYTTKELLYRPRNKRTHKLYGYSPVEQIVMTINIALRRQIWQLQSFTEGNIPEALIGVPAGWTPDQISQFQDWFDSILEGNTAQRRKAKFVPGDIAKSFFSTKPDKLFDMETEEWIGRVVCFAFSIPPTPFVKQMNRATAESAQEAALEEGLSPIMNWVKAVMDTFIIDDFEAPELEFGWADEDELDPDAKSKIIDREVANGTQTFNEARAEQGRERIEHPDADRPMFKGAAGYTPIFLTPEEQAKKDAAAAAIAGGGASGGDDNTDAPPGASPSAPSPAQDASDADLTADDEVADDDEPGPSADEEVGVKPKKEGARKSDTPFGDPPEAGGTLNKEYNEDQPRDDNGRFGEGGSSGSSDDKEAKPYSMNSVGGAADGTDNDIQHTETGRYEPGQSAVDRSAGNAREKGFQYTSQETVEARENQAKEEATFDKDHFAGGQLEKSEMQAVTKFCGTESKYAQINTAVRSGDNGKWEKTVSNLDSAIAGEHLTQETTLYRGIAGLTPEQIAGLGPGSTISDKGFQSTTWDRDHAGNFATGRPDGFGTARAGGVMMEVEAPRGTNALNIHNGRTGSGILNKGSEREVLLGRNTHFTITSTRVERINGVDVTVLGARIGRPPHE